MTYAYDRAIPLPVQDLYDTQIMAMSINAARDMYKEGQKRIDDFYEKYGDFTSPIQKDMDWYAQNVTGKARDVINKLYANGIDPLRSAEGRAVVAQLINSMPVGDIAKVRQSAAAANEYLKNKGLLQRAGKYDPDLNERFLGYNLDQFDTINGGQVWNVTSPLEAQSLKDLTEKSFNNRSPLELTKDDVESFGVKYDPRAKYTGFAKRHIQDIADKVAPGLYGTPYMDYYRDLAKRKLEAAGIEPTKDNIDRQLANDIADSQEEWLMGPKADLSDYWNRVKIGLQAEQNRLAREKFNWQKERAAAAQAGEDNPGVSLASAWYSKGVANAWSADGITKNWYEMNKDKYGQFSNQALKLFTDFGKTQLGKKRGDAMKAFENKFSIRMDEESVASIIGSPVDGNKKVAKASDAAIDKLYGVYDVVSNTAGFTKGHSNQTTSSIRNAIRTYGAANTTITPLGTGYGSLRKVDGSFKVMPKVRVVVTDNSGKVVLKKDAYYDIDLSSAGTSGGAYIKDYRESGGFKELGTPGSHYDAQLKRFVPNDVSYVYESPVTTKELNLYPDYNQWNGYGVWDTRETSKQLKAKASSELGTEPIFEDE